jgi:Ca2+-binding RTX toxin-like protein
MADTTLAIPQEITDLPNLPSLDQGIARTVPPTIINGTEKNDIIATTAGNDIVNALGGNDGVKGSKGNDFINGGKGIDTIDYFSLGGPVRLGPAGKVFKGPDGSFGEDQLIGFETIIGSKGVGDLIDGSTASSGTVPINVNLDLETLSVIGIPGLGTQTFSVRNFEDVNGTNIADVITGDRKSNKIDGGGGNDILAGTVGSFVRSTEKDILTGGEGADTFILGSGDTLFYSSNKNADFATITDFGNGADQIFLADGDYATNDGFTQLFAIKADGTLDLIAKITSFEESLGSSESFSQKQSPELSFSAAPADTLGSNITFSLSKGQSFGIFTAGIV